MCVVCVCVCVCRFLLSLLLLLLLLFDCCCLFKVHEFASCVWICFCTLTHVTLFPLFLQAMRFPDELLSQPVVGSDSDAEEPVSILEEEEDEEDD
jgi:hypothetical protein